MSDGTATEDEKAAYRSNLIGCWGISDLTRIQGAITQLTADLEARGINVATSGVIFWPNVFITKGMVIQILNNIELILRAYIRPVSAPAVPSAEGEMTFTKANDIETILFLVDSILDKHKAGMKRFSGTLYSGEYII